MDNQFITTKLNLDEHYALVSEQDLVYLLNGDIQGDEGSVNGFVQNTPSNELCLDLEGYTMIGPGISIGAYERVLFLKDQTTNWIWKADLKNCSHEVWASGDCLAFDPDYPIRGVYKHNNKDNDRRVYFIDGLNYNRYLDIDQSFPQVRTNSYCDECIPTYNGVLDCDALRINKSFDYPCLTFTGETIGTLASGVYQVAIAYSENGVKYSDFFFSDILKVHSVKDNIGFNLSIDCVDTPFDQIKVILISNTQDNGLVIYEIGDYASNTDFIDITDLTNATILSSQEALEKRVVYDKSQHIVTNGETLLLGKHETVEPLDYQKQALDIELYWAEGRVPKSKAHLYPTLMRDEVGAFSISWFDDMGQHRGDFHIPGKPNTDFSIYFSGNTYVEQDDAPAGAYIWELDSNCDPKTKKVWELENTATVEAQFSSTCEICEDLPTLNAYGKMGYYECESLTYPDDVDTWGALACQPIRHHRLPSSKISHIHNQAECFTATQVVMDYDEFGTPVEDITYSVEYIEDDCINILGIIPKNIPYPKDSDGNDITNWKYRISYAKRNSGNKSILHKGLIFNTFQEITYEGTDQQIIYYPNYPYNDLKSDIFISKTQTGHQYEVESFVGNGYISSKKFTYHSPDVHFRETRNEFGNEVKLYTEEIGKIKGDFNPVYQHSDVAIDSSSLAITSFKYARQLDSICNYSNYEVVDLPFTDRRFIENSQYLLPIKQVVESSTKFNNLMREDGYFFSIPDTDDDIPNPTNEDTSRFRISEIGCETSFNYCSQVNRSGTDYDVQGVSYYAGIKVPQPNQYGSLEQITYVPVEHCLRETDGMDVLDLTNVWWGGDTYITKHRIARKMPLFTEWLDNVAFDESDFDYRPFRNVYYPRYWVDRLTESVDRYRLDCHVHDLGPNDEEFGYFYIWINGILDFWCESEFIGDFREEDARPSTRYYPTTDVEDLFRADTIRDQPIFLYNLALLNGDIYNTKQTLNLTSSDADFTVIYSLNEDPQSASDNWLKFLPLNYTILPRVYGEFTGMHYTDQYSILFAFENMMLYSQEDYTQTTNEGNTIFLSQGDIFSRRLRKMSNEKTGYTGCVDPFSFVNTRYGTMYFDRYRKTWFMWAGGLEPIGANQAWFRQFTSNDNPGYKDSIITVYDNNSKNVFITDKVTGWTLSYKPGLKGFVSFHSFIPDWYCELPDNFISAKDGLWKHGVLFDYQTYYGTVYPFDIGFVIKATEQTLQSFEVFSDWIKYESWGSPVYIKDQFFDSLLVYNDRTSTGIIPLILKNESDPSQSLLQNKDQYLAEVSEVYSNIYRINKLESIQEGTSNIEIGANGWTYNTKNLLTKAPWLRSELKGKWFIVHLISTQNTHKIITQANKSQAIQNFK